MQAGCRVWFLLSAALIVCGCRSNTNQQILESELRAREIQMRETRDELKKSELQSQALQREVHALRQGQQILPEQAAAMFGVQRITIGRASGGFENDNLPGDEALHLVLEPRDDHGDVIKAPGCLHVTAVQINPQGIKSVLCSWDVDAESMRQEWKQGLFSTGYVLVLPWKNWPVYENLRIVARLTMPDGRVFEADRDVKIRVAPGMPRPAESNVSPEVIPSKEKSGPPIIDKKITPAPNKATSPQQPSAEVPMEEPPPPVPAVPENTPLPPPAPAVPSAATPSAAPPSQPDVDNPDSGPPLKYRSNFQPAFPTNPVPQVMLLRPIPVENPPLQQVHTSVSGRP